MQALAPSNAADKQAEAAALVAGLRKWARAASTQEQQRTMLKAADWIEAEAKK